MTWLGSCFGWVALALLLPPPSFATILSNLPHVLSVRFVFVVHILNNDLDPSLSLLPCCSQGWPFANTSGYSPSLVTPPVCIQCLRLMTSFPVMRSCCLRCARAVSTRCFRGPVPCRFWPLFMELEAQISRRGFCCTLCESCFSPHSLSYLFHSFPVLL